MINDKLIKSRVISIDLLRVICAFAVVGIHISMTQPNNYTIQELGEQNYLFLTSIYATVQWAVPIFLMISGNLLLNSKDITLIKVKKYIVRMAITLILFGTAYALMELVFNEKNFTIEMIFKSVLLTMEGKSWSHLWYIYTLIGIYLVLIPLKKFVDHSSKKEINFILLILIIGNFVIPEINSLFGTSIDSFMVFTQYVTYFLIGYFILDYIQIKGRGKCIALWCIATMLKIISQIVSVKYYNVDSPLLVNDKILTLCQASAIYVFMINYSNCSKIKPIFSSISKCSFGIYLIHPFFINLLYKGFHITPTNFIHIGFGVPFLWFSVFLVSWLTTWMITKLPYFKRII